PSGQQRGRRGDARRLRPPARRQVRRRARPCRRPRAPRGNARHHRLPAGTHHGIHRPTHRALRPTEGYVTIRPLALVLAALGAAGLITASTGAPKIVELRDFSGEGRVALSAVTPSGDGTVSVGGRKLSGAGRIGRLTSATTWYAGQLAELPLGKVPAADLNGDGNNTDVFPVIVVKAPDGWVAFLDSNLNGSFEDEMPLHDYRQGRETIALGAEP